MDDDTEVTSFELQQKDLNVDFFFMEIEIRQVYLTRADKYI